MERVAVPVREAFRFSPAFTQTSSESSKIGRVEYRISVVSSSMSGTIRSSLGCPKPTRLDLSDRTAEREIK
jgi:hypothetical protein